ncbi:PAS domain S-box protein [Bacillus sp. DTU_2020_1000418_1_SI_GHA_SEK_038]|uniref:PAS domain-containing sensor histidine kinase n=1 Tax=Bacillus sp. DTU_2020_1000418_1_SI_GHA_SEK_038 TaxID=3077585 RepID=UPI0028E4F766|nr:PAS domain S-box protein [Bacillus sp. DTU_2020_1000418_1_SI_GHA_SEK_038]WNS76443.1 PAS domain S-box protein [Bacillus sp. DTU_2020_1000418_1_SI_GHA_SEK_038]
MELIIGFILAIVVVFILVFFWTRIKKKFSRELSNQRWKEESLKTYNQELVDTIRLQQGMIFKFIKDGDRFIHTLCDGRLLYRMDLFPEKIIGNELCDFLPHLDAETVIQYYWRAWQGEDNVTYEGGINGVYYLASLRPIRKKGEVVEIIGSCVDITERKRVENALKLSEDNYRLITENMLDLVGLWDIDGRVIYASPSHEKVLGFDPKKYIGVSAFDLVHPDDSLRVYEQFFQMISTKLPFQVEFRCENADGEWVYVEAQGTPVIGESDKLEHIVVVGRNISERKKVDEFIRKTEKLSLVGQLAAGVAHEIRNPLTSIKGFLQLMQMEIDKPNYLEIMLSEIDSIEKIIQEFLSLSKPQASKLAPTDINELLQYVITLINTRAKLKNIAIVQESDSELPIIHCDEHQIKQVFVNILQNAVEAMENGGVIQIQTMRSESDNIRFRIIDQGCGISEDRIKSIGEPFYSTKEKGTGLGLMISHKIVQEHGGTLSLESTINKGTIVDVILPIGKSEPVLVTP